MKSCTLTVFLTSNFQIEEAEIFSIIEHCNVKTVQKNEFLLRQGELCKHTFFIEKGLLRQYSIDEKGKGHILHFAPENWFVTDSESTHFNQPSTYFIQALEDSKVVLLNEEFVRLISQKIPSFIDFNNQLLHNHVRQLQNRITQLLSASAEERYLDFIKTYPDILLRVPQTMIASYLGITPESLSRIRKELAQRNWRT